MFARLIRPLFFRSLASHWRGPSLVVHDRPSNQVRKFGRQQSNTITITIHSQSFWKHLAYRGLSYAFGLGYETGNITVYGSLPDLLRGFYQSEVKPPRIYSWLKPLLYQPASIIRVIRNARYHYEEQDTDFYRLWLDPSLGYTCGYFPTGEGDSLTGQEKKLGLICRKLQLENADSFLDIGCGWGALLNYAVEHYRVPEAIGITPCANQTNHINNLKSPPGSSKVHAFKKTWQEYLVTTPNRFNAVATVGCLEHFGLKVYPAYFKASYRVLKPVGRLLVQTIGHSKETLPDPFIATRVFPGGYLPTLSQITIAAEKAGFIVLDVENLRPHYVETLKRWLERFENNREKICARYGESLWRRYHLYLHGSLAGFLSGDLQLYQILLIKPPGNWPLDERHRYFANSGRAVIE